METKSIMIVGVGGQGTLLTSRIIGELNLRAGHDVKVSEVHGMAQRGGSVVTYVRYGSQVAEPVVEEGEADILIAFECLEALRYVHFLKKGGILILNEQRINPVTVVIGKAVYPDNILERLSMFNHVIAIDAIHEAIKLGNVRVFNSIILGIAARYMEFEKEDWLSVIDEIVPEHTVDLNKKAFLTGYAMAYMAKIS